MYARTMLYAVASAMMMATLFLLSPMALAATYSVPGDYMTIGTAIANASAGDTIIVDGGSYGEHVVIDRGLTLLGRDSGSGRPTIDAMGVEISADNVVIQGFRVRGAARGIDVRGCGNTRVLDCMLVDNGYGIMLTGVRGGIVMNNTVTGSRNTGIYLSDSNGNALYRNVVTGNQYGIALTGSSASNTVYMNTLEDNPGANALANGRWNSWNSSIPFTYGYGGRQFSRSQGNYWGDIRGSDADGDGILDTPVMLAENNGDYSPLAEEPVSRPLADFASNTIQGTAPLAVQFADATRGYPVSWRWDFGDGGTSGLQNPSHVYESAGSYTVSLTVANAHGEDRLIRGGYIAVIAPTAPESTPAPWPTATPTAIPSGTTCPTPSSPPRPTPGAAWPLAIAAMAAAWALTGRRG